MRGIGSDFLIEVPSVIRKDPTIVKEAKTGSLSDSPAPPSGDDNDKTASGEHSGVQSGVFQFPVHRALLAARSPVFAAMLQHDTKESREGRMTLDGASQKAVALFIEYLYGGKCIGLTPSLARELLVLADRYLVGGLAAQCCSQLCQTVDEISVVESLLLADRHGLISLKKACFLVLHANMENVGFIAGFPIIAASPPLMVQFVQWQAGYTKGLQSNRLRTDRRRAIRMEIKGLNDDPDEGLDAMAGTSSGLHDSIANFILEDLANDQNTSDEELG